jgi:acetoin:2,6-dichlorophenolindophenol oxidoreductase subunit beta
MSSIRFASAIHDAIHEEMRRDARIYTYGVNTRVMAETMGLMGEFEIDRAFETPISENSISGMAIGMALAGYRPIVFHSSGGYVYAGMEEMVAEASTWRLTHAGKVSVPLVWVIAAGGGYQTGASHSHFPVGEFMHHPGIKIVVPSNPADAKGLMKTAIRDDNPVVVFSQLGLNAMVGEVPDNEYAIPFGQANVPRSGTDVTVVAYSAGTNSALRVAEKLGGSISVEVIDLRTIEPLDLDCILQSVEKTGRLVVVDQDTSRAGVSSEISALVSERAFGSLQAPVARVARRDIPVPGGPLEKVVLPNDDRLAEAIEGVMTF